jgi:DNA-binding MarR family transcriptional regulator
MKKITDGEEIFQFIDTFNLWMSETRRYSSELLSRYRITTPQLTVLRVLKIAGDLRLSDLSVKINLTNSTVTGIIDRLERAGLVSRQRSTDDRRVILVKITAKGRETADQVPAPHLELIRNAFFALSEEDRAELLRLLRKFHQAITALLPQPPKSNA